MSSTFVQFVGLGVGSIRLRRELATKENLAFLFALETAEGLLLVSPEGDELELGDIEAGHIVHVLSEGDLRDDCPFTMDRSLMTEEIRARAQEELQRRLIQMRAARILFIQEHYRPLHPSIFIFQLSFLDDRLTSAFQEGRDIAEVLVQETPTKIFSFPLLTIEFCNLLIEEIEK